MKRSATIKKFGDYSGQPICGFFEETLESGFPKTQLFGLDIDCVVPNTLLYDEDGKVWLIYRFTDYKASMGLNLSTNAEGHKLSQPHPQASKAFAGLIGHRIEGDAHIIEPLAPAKNGFYYKRTLEGIEWREGDWLSLTGVRMCPAKSWFAFDGMGGWGFSSFVSRVSGTLFGRKVNGFSEFATQFMPHGESLIAHYRQKVASWMIMCNEYDNGEYDFCHLGVLADGGRFGLVGDEKGPITATTNVEFEAYVDANGFPDKLIYTVDGEPWIWNASENSDVGTLEHPTSRDRIGVAQRQGDTRTPRYTYAWVNFYNDDRLKPYIK